MDAGADPPENTAPVGSEDTEPLPVVPGSWAAVNRDLDAAVSPGRNATPRRRAGRKRALVLTGAAVVAVAAAGVVGFAVIGSDENPAADNPVDADSARDPEAEEHLLARLPSAYPGSSCQTVDPPRGTLAQVICEATAEPQAPAATYTLVADEDALTAAFDRMTARSSVVVCPGRIQSPGPWRRNATPEVVSGIVVCAADSAATTVGWTDEASLLLSEIRSDAGTVNLEQLFAWWSSHS